MSSKILIIGAGGQIGSELTAALRAQYGIDNVITSDINDQNKEMVNSGPFEVLDAKNKEDVYACVKKHNIDVVYLMAALLSATGEKYPLKAWHLNTESLFHVLNLAKEGLIKQIFWPSSIAVFGLSTPKINTPQRTICEPTTVYGITKQVGERWCKYYHSNYGVDVRSIRYPGIISHKTMPGGGTTDYAVEIYHKALTEGRFTCFLKEDTLLPMMFMDDAIKGTLQLMEAPGDSLTVRSSYNLSALSFTPKEIFESIKKHIPDFKISYEPDFRQKIADSWPCSIDDSVARADWGWQHGFDLNATTDEMLKHLRLKYNVGAEQLS
jgi:nucleoside-diphosphate-sugar epimerase